MLWASRIVGDRERGQQEYFVWGGEKERNFTVREILWGGNEEESLDAFDRRDAWQEKREEERGLSLIPPRSLKPRGAFTHCYADTVSPDLPTIGKKDNAIICGLCASSSLTRQGDAA